MLSGSGPGHVPPEAALPTAVSPADPSSRPLHPSCFTFRARTGRSKGRMTAPTGSPLAVARGPGRRCGLPVPGAGPLSRGQTPFFSSKPRLQGLHPLACPCQRRPAVVVPAAGVRRPVAAMAAGFEAERSTRVFMFPRPPHRITQKTIPRSHRTARPTTLSSCRLLRGHRARANRTVCPPGGADARSLSFPVGAPPPLADRRRGWPHGAPPGRPTRGNRGAQPPRAWPTAGIPSTGIALANGGPLASVILAQLVQYGAAGVPR